jgi:hypothetical protein
VQRACRHWQSIPVFSAGSGGWAARRRIALTDGVNARPRPGFASLARHFHLHARVIILQNELKK